MKKQSTTPKEVLTTREACEYLKISRNTLFALIKAGEIAYVNVGKVDGKHKRYLFLISTLRDWIKSKEQRDNVGNANRDRADDS